MRGRKWTRRYRRMDPVERLVKMWIMAHARASFRKKGPGITAQLREALFGMSQEFRAIAQRKGWDRGILKKSKSGKLLVA